MRACSTLVIYFLLLFFFFIRPCTHLFNSFIVSTVCGACVNLSVSAIYQVLYFFPDHHQPVICLASLSLIYNCCLVIRHSLLVRFVYMAPLKRYKCIYYPFLLQTFQQYIFTLFIHQFCFLILLFFLLPLVRTLFNLSPFH